MASNKKSVVIYCDLIHTIEKLTDEQAGQFFKHFLRYVNDQKPEAPSLLIDAVFEPTRQQLKRDLQNWESKKVARIEAGRLGGLAKASKAKQKLANLPVNVNGNVNVNVNDNVKKKKGFAPPSLKEVKKYFKEKGYSEESAAKAFDYYEANDWMDSHGNKVKSWKQKMIGIWFKDENKKKNSSKNAHLFHS